MLQESEFSLPFYNDWAVIKRSLQIMFYCSGKGIFKRGMNLVNIPSQYKKLIEYALDNSVNRAVIAGYLLYSPQKPTEKVRILLTLFIGMISAIDDIVDTQYLVSVELNDFHDLLLNHQVVNKNGQVLDIATIQDFYKLLPELTTKEQLLSIQQFIRNALQIELVRLELRKLKREFTLEEIRDYRAQTTEAYSFLLADLVSHDQVTAKTIASFTRLFQIYDDINDFDNDIKLGDANYLVSMLRDKEFSLQKLKEECDGLVKNIPTPFARWFMGIVAWSVRVRIRYKLWRVVQ
jgi:hypothetical protein